MKPLVPITNLGLISTAVFAVCLMPLSVSAADVAVAMFAADASVAAVGQVVIYSVLVRNNGPGPQTVPSAAFGFDWRRLTFRRTTCGGISINGWQTWQLPDLAEGEEWSCRIVMQVNACDAIETVFRLDVADDDTVNNNAAAVLNQSLQIVADPGFEAGKPNPFWEEASTNYGSPITCPASVCWGNCRVSFGGRPLAVVPEDASVAQSLVIPSAPQAWLRFQTMASLYSDGADYLRAKLDDSLLFELREQMYNPGYVLREIDVSSFADGGSHALRFEFRKHHSKDYDYFLVDQVSLHACLEHDAELFFDDFSDGDQSGDKDWRTIKGRWKVNDAPNRNFVSSSWKNSRALAKKLEASPVAVGRISAKIKLTRRFVRSANAAVIFDYWDEGHFRYVRLKPKKIIIGQVGEMGGEPDGIKAKIDWPIRLGAWHAMRLDLTAGGVAVYENDAYIWSCNFNRPLAGAVGLWSKRARTLYDDIMAQDESVLP